MDRMAAAYTFFVTILILFSMDTLHRSMPTLHRIPSLRFTFVPYFCMALFAWCLLTGRANAQQENHPVPDTACQCGGGAMTNTPTNAGTDFLLCFEENIDASYDYTPAYCEIYVASLDDTATVTITSRLHPSLNKVYFLQAHSSITDKISDDSVQGAPMHDLWIVSDEVPDNTVVEVQSTSPIVCYGMDYKSETADAFCAIAKESAGTDYSIMSYPNSQTASPNTASQFAVAAFEDDDTVTITPSAPTLGGHLANDSFQVILQQGQCVQVQTNPNDSGLDLTGSRVWSNHPVTVYSGHQRTEAPRFWVDTLNLAPAVSRDMLLEVMPPTSTWGRAFVINAIDLDIEDTIAPGGDIMRVLALDSNTVVSVNGNIWDTLGSKNHPSLFSDTMVALPTLVTSSDPLLVGQIEHSDCYQGNGGDPSLSIVPPVDQLYNNYTFFTSTDNNFGYNGVIIATDTNSQGTISVDGTPIPHFFFNPVPGNVGGQSFSTYEDPLLTSGVHTISSTMLPKQGFTILVYGIGSVISYGYTAGELLVPKRTIRIENPPVASLPVHTNTLNFHNTAYQPAYLDSAVFVPDNFKDAGYNIHTAEDVGLDIGRVDIGGSGQIHLISDLALSYPVSGTEKIYSHCPSYVGLEPGTMHVTVYPTSADVSQAGQLAITVTATPNPFSSYTYINFSVPTTGDITMTLYDELGRAVQHIASSEFSAGPYSVRIDRRGLADGVYVCEITSTKLNIHTRIPIVAGE